MSLLKEKISEYPVEFRLNAIKLADELGNVREACRQLKIHPETLRLWRNQLTPGWVPKPTKGSEKKIYVSAPKPAHQFMGMAEVILTKGKENAH